MSQPEMFIPVVYLLAFAVTYRAFGGKFPAVYRTLLRFWAAALLSGLVTIAVFIGWAATQ